MDPQRSATLEVSETVVVKVGTNVLADVRGRLDFERIQALAAQLNRLRATGRKVALVSSGAIGAGLGMLCLSQRPTDLAELQACAAVGQPYLMQSYQKAFEAYGVRTAQLLLTAADFDHRARYLNVRNTLRTLFEYGTLPIINENDTVSTAEIKFGDNDQLAAMTANLLQAQLLILLTNVDGLYSADPRLVPNATLHNTIPRIDREIASLASATKSGLGTGGMKSKLRAARLVTAAGGAVIMANGSLDRVLDRLFAGESLGTLFLPEATAISARKRWLGFTATPRGEFWLDQGAVQAIVANGKSLLPIGVRQCRGIFQKGDLVILRDQFGQEVGRGLTNFSAQDAQKIIGLKGSMLAEVLGTIPYHELVHRDHLVITSA